MGATEPRRASPERQDAAAGLPDRIAFLGLGLIGGSVALALRRSGYRGVLTAWTPDGRGPAQGIRSGVVDEAATSAVGALDGAGLVVLAGPPLAILDHAASLGGPWRGALAAGATVTDVGSTKERIVAAADTAALRFVGGHPMAGREASGLGAAMADLFVDRPWVVVPCAAATPSDIARVESLARAAGGRPVHLGARDHDAAVAAISHLPLVLSAALVEAVAVSPGGVSSWSTARTLAATGWRDMTRLAMGDPEMGAGILATNAPALAARLRDARTIIDAWIAELDAVDGEAPAPEGLRERLAAARSALAADSR